MKPYHVLLFVGSLLWGVLASVVVSHGPLPVALCVVGCVGYFLICETYAMERGHR